MNYLAAVVHTGRSEIRPLFPRRRSREAAVFAAAVALFVDAVFYATWAGDQLSGGPLAFWSALKVLVIVAGVAWLAWKAEAWSFGIIAIIFGLIGLEDSVGVTAPLGLWLIQESGIRRGPQGANTQLLRRAFVMVSFLGPTLYLASRAPQWLRRAVWVLIGFLGAIFVAAVLGDVVADRSGTNLDEVLEEPLLSLCAAFVVGLVVEWLRRAELNPTRR